MTPREEGKAKRRVPPNSPVRHSIGRVFEWVGILALIGPGVTLTAVGCVEPLISSNNPPVRDFGSGLVGAVGFILLMYGGLFLSYLVGPQDP
jgi:hypothetical protein